MDKETEQLISSIPAIIIGLGPSREIVWWNSQAESTLGLASSAVIGRPFNQCDLNWDWTAIEEALEDCQLTGQPKQMRPIRLLDKKGQEHWLGLTINPLDSTTKDHPCYTILGDDCTQRHKIENQLARAQKMEAIGHLAAGIAHEISTPAQFVGDNTHFLGDAFKDLLSITASYSELLDAVKHQDAHAELIEKIRDRIKSLELDYLVEEIPAAIDHMAEGVTRISKIVQSMKMFSHPGGKEFKPLDINDAIENTITITRNEWKYAAEVITDLDDSLPLVPCLGGDLNQTLLNLVTNAAHAIAEANQHNGSAKGKITITTRKVDPWAEIRISDTGHGIPEEIQDRVFDLFFTTKEEGCGSGQGLAIAHKAIVDKHHGRLSFDSQAGSGTTFNIHIPLQQEEGAIDSLN